MLTGLIGDTQFPAVHPGYLDFCLDVFDAWGGADEVVHMGDLVDLHNQSFHDMHPEMPGPVQEWEQAVKLTTLWHDHFKNVIVLRGNHDERALRVGAKMGVPEIFFRPMADLWNTPTWQYVHEHVSQGVLFVHGHGGGGGEHPAYNYLKKINDYSVSMGHFHTRAGIKWLVGPLSRRFGMDVGCGVDRLHPAMQYDKHNPLKPVLACAVVKDGHPYHELMPCGPGEKYHRSRFKGRRK